MIITELDPLDGIRATAVKDLVDGGALVAIAISVDQKGNVNMASFAEPGRDALVKRALDAMLQRVALKEAAAICDQSSSHLAVAVHAGLKTH